jgi:transposase
MLGMTIRLEAGAMGRFAPVGDFASDCRGGSSQTLSNGNRQGQGKGKNGHKDWAWALVEAATCAVRDHAQLNRCSQRKPAKTTEGVAIKVGAQKWARAGYSILRDPGPCAVDKAVT